LAITAAGNVGIGTTAPTSNLEVVGTTSVSIAVRSGTNTFDGSYIVGTGQYESVYDARVSGNASGSRVIRFGNVNGGNFTFRALADTGETVLRTPISFSNAAPTGSLYILSSGNVGIGTTAPSSKLHVVGDASISGNISLSNGSVTVLGVRGFTLTPGDGIFQFLNNAQTGFDRIQLGGASTGHPAIKRNGASIDITLASDGITFTSIQDLYRRFGAGSPEGVVVAPTGAVYHNTSGGAATTFYVKESSPTPSTGWVGK
jgi:hypothetical protein